MTQPYRPNLITKLYYAYKSIRLPFRRKVFRGFDLDGNKFYESYNPLTPNKWRRTVQYVHDGHYTDNNVTPQWMSWLRYTRPNPPTMDELRGEVVRIQSTRLNAQLISRRWEEERERLSGLNQASLSEPQVQTQAQAQTEQSEEQVLQRQGERESVLREAQRQDQDADVRGDDRQGEYMVAPGTRDEKGEWQPEAWNPASAARKPIRRS
ncbi:Putative uncharacterized protein [Taphrina deformans PYCC 5710]|uniref:Uncharacterized protein n=1 Tax=Taphrina deformans (strain PYCC 5710 / ATCC 11124 / CBS 356.35 / IMI 108563 / JCM 9778 / NBRC 8474) TaxID=1097556 RepID=R4XDM0_TAPDE|nr:Putative uncharacterized protein [Taphrina deformans PYCC 5710]|eukprot:CCG81439.1 Putative uncharacterized protein [Taphrina deformans PYCC 5710]